MERRAALVGIVIVLVVAAALAFSQAPLHPWCTIGSLRRIDDHPLYVMRFYGDYGFGAFLERGIASDRVGSLDQQEAGWACSGFSASGPAGGALFGRNFDWHDRPTLLLFTDPPDGYASVSMVDMAFLGFPADAPSWRERWALLDAPYWPIDGMNERGLAVGMMAVPHGRDAADPGRVTIGSLHAIRLLLDYAADVEEAIALLRQYRIDFGGGPPIHYLLGDAKGDSAVVEHIDGRMTVVRSEGPWQASTNFLMSPAPPEGAQSPCWRYNRLVEALEQTQGSLTQAEVMSLLQDVSQPNTVWSVVYDMANGDISVTVGRDYDQVHEFELPMTP